MTSKRNVSVVSNKTFRKKITARKFGKKSVKTIKGANSYRIRKIKKGYKVYLY
jgi:hypothetical protein